MRRFRLILPLLILFSTGIGAEDFESFYQEGKLIEEVRFDPYGNPLESRFYHEGRLEEERVYSYEDYQVQISITHHLPDGTSELLGETLYLREDGSLRMMERQRGDSSLMSGWSSQAEWIGEGNSKEIYLYGTGGELLERIFYADNVETEKEVLSYNSEGLLLSSRLERSGESFTTFYNIRGLAEEVRHYRDGLLVSQSGYVYNERDQVVSEKKEGQGRLAEWTWLYDGEGTLLEEKSFQNGLLTRKVIYDGEERTEELYNKGELTLTVYYRGTEIIGEEKQQ
ncbi:MAG: hypothetical protein PQJ59_05405 [Spirochaetales bacterium]|nr:hypothetical protein [Spirochaetales bacterium]